MASVVVGRGRRGGWWPTICSICEYAADHLPQLALTGEQQQGTKVQRRDLLLLAELAEGAPGLCCGRLLQGGAVE